MAETKRENELDDIERGWDEDADADEGAPDESNPDLAKLDSGWEGDIDDLFKDEEEEGAKEDEADEPPLPDERLDPVAFAEAKKAREERLEAKRVRRKAKLDVKRQKLLAKRAATRGKQKQKQKTKPKPKPVRPERNAKRQNESRDTSPSPSMEDVGAVVSSVRRPDMSKTARAARASDAAALAKGVPWKLVALGIVVFLAAAAAIAAIASR